MKRVETRGNRNSDFVSRWTSLDAVINAVADRPSTSLEAWISTTAGIVAMLLCLQLITGLLLAFYYVPSSEAAHTTVAYIEKVVAAGPWIRALHHYGSDWLPLFLVLHIGQLIWRESYARKPVGWLASVALLILVLGEAATGYSLPWDIRAFFATRVTEGLVGGLPFFGRNLRQWLLGGVRISPATLGRFFALHALLLPFLVLAVAAGRLFVFRDRNAVPELRAKERDRSWIRAQFTRNVIAAGVVFFALAIYATRFPAPLGPPANMADLNYLPRPGSQFLWLFQLLRFMPGGLASVVAIALPAIVLVVLALLPFLSERIAGKPALRKFIPALYSLTILTIAGLTVLAYVTDARDPAVREQLVRQEQQEAEFRAQPFEPLRLNSSGEQEEASASPSPSATPTAGPVQSTSPTAKREPPESFVTNCAACHGMRGEGTALFPKLIGVSQKPRRTAEDLVGILNDPAAYGLRPPMKSYADKLTEQEKSDIAAWLLTLRKRR
jgi:ubiquinol-cytochrome c reductase cytochrome b subunit